MKSETLKLAPMWHFLLAGMVALMLVQMCSRPAMAQKPAGAVEYTIIAETSRYKLYRHLVGNSTICYITTDTYPGEGYRPSIACVKE